MPESQTAPVRVRFAPSPTGYLHIGGARTALFNWLFARKHQGVFILRIEDTDQRRYVAESEKDIMENLRWLGLDWDEGPMKGGDYGPYRQSERSEMYREWAEYLVEKGLAYRCTCSAERLESLREEQLHLNLQPGYDRHCRELRLGPDCGEHVIRFKMPLDGETTVFDQLRGPIIFQNAELQDLVLLKSDGLPTYHLANVVDDHFMEISHIMRADEWIATAPLHARLYEAFGWQMPAIAHLPVILSPSGKGKLSKRDQAFSDSGTRVLVQVREFRQAGYLPEAVVNFLTNVGWAFGDDREIFTPEEAMARFDLSQINPAPGKLPYDKLTWLNGHYIREMDVPVLAGYIRPFLLDAGLAVPMEKLVKAVPLIRERIKTLDEAVEWLDFLFMETITVIPGDLIQKGMDRASTLATLDRASSCLGEMGSFTATAIERELRALAEESGVKAGQLFGTLRTATSGKNVAPPLFETLEILGKDVTLARIQAARDLLATQPAD